MSSAAQTKPIATLPAEAPGDDSAWEDQLARLVQEAREIEDLQRELVQEIHLAGQALKRKNPSYRAWSALGGKYSGAVLDLLDLVQSESGQSSEDVVVMALSLFRQVIRAEKQGQTIAILDSDDSVVKELTGFSEPLDIPAILRSK